MNAGRPPPSSPWRAELRRKAVHVIAGTACLALPWLLDEPAPLAWLAPGFLGLLWLVRRVPALRRGPGRVLHGVGRETRGDLWFVVAVAVLFWAAAGHVLRFLVPLGVLTFADAAAALVGCSRDPGHKTLRGSAAFLLVASGVVFGALCLGTTMSAGRSLALALITALVTTALEWCGRRGLDNVLVPLGAAAVLWPALPDG